MPNVKACKEIIKRTPAEQALLFYGEKGTAKSEVIESMALETNMIYCPFFLGQMQDAGDMIGLMVPDHKTGRSVHLTPDWFPEGDEPVLFHLDEVNRAKPELFSTINNLVLRGELNGKKLPKGSRVIATINPPDEEGTYSVEDMDEALLSRFNIYAWVLEYEDWRPWAKESGVNELVIGYLDKNPDHLHKTRSTIGTNKKGTATEKDWKSTDCRAWVRVSKFLNANKDIEKTDHSFCMTVISGIIGHVITAKFMNYVKDMKKGIDVKDILFAEDENQLKIQLDKVRSLNPQEQGLLNSNFEQWFTDNHKSITGKTETAKTKRVKVLANLKSYLEAIGNEIAAEFVVRLVDSSKSENKWGEVILASMPSIVLQFISVKQAKNS